MTLMAYSRTYAERVTASEGGLCRPRSIKKRLGEPNPQAHDAFRLEAQKDTNPVRPAERRYLQGHGREAYAQLLARLFEELFPTE